MPSNSTAPSNKTVSPSPTLPLTSSNFSIFTQSASTHELSTSRSPSPIFSCINANTFIQEAREIVAKNGQSDRATLHNELTSCANRFIQWNLDEVQCMLRNPQLNVESPLFIAILHEQSAQQAYIALLSKANLLSKAIFYYIRANDFERSRGCIAKLINTHQYQYVSDMAEQLFNHETHPAWCAVLFEVSALMLSQQPEHAGRLDENERRELIDEYWLYAVYHATLSSEFTYAKQLAFLYLIDVDISDLLVGPIDITPPLYQAIISDVIIRKLLKNSPSRHESNVIEQQRGQIMLHFKSAIEGYASAGDISQLKIILIVYHNFDKSGALLAKLNHSQILRAAISETLETLLDSEENELADLDRKSCSL